MSTKNRVDPELAPMMDMFPSYTMSLDFIPQFREGIHALRQQLDLGETLKPKVWQMEPTKRTPAIDLHVYNHDPKRSGRPLIVHFHGGAMIAGLPGWHWLEPALLETDAVGVSVDYRLAPECTFPGPEEDCYAGLVWAVAHAAELGIDPRKVIVSGESAGGLFAAAVAIMARDRGEVQLAGQALVYPAVDWRTGGPDCPWKNPSTGDFMAQKENSQFAWMCLKGEYGVDDERAPYFSPALLEDFTGLPATYIMTAALDLLVDEGLDYARRLNAAGVPTELHLYPGVPHGFDFIPGTAAVKTAALRDYVAGVRRLFSNH